MLAGFLPSEKSVDRLFRSKFCYSRGHKEITTASNKLVTSKVKILYY